MKRLLVIIVISFFAFSEANASDFNSVCSSGQTLYYNIISTTDHTVSITFPGSSTINGWEGYVKPSGYVVIPATVDYAGQTYTVVRIDWWAFAGCGSLTGVSIPNTITEIGNSSFWNSGITNITIPSSVNYIKSNAFWGSPCTTIVIDNPNVILEEEVFHNTTWYNNVSAGLIYIGTILYECKGTIWSPTSISISPNTTSIAGRAFYQQSNITSISLPNSLKSIGYQAFYACSGLTTLTIPSSVEYIARNAFENCGGLTTVNWNAVNCKSHIGNFSSDTPFGGCDNLSTLNIAQGVMNIPDYAFHGCSNLSGSLLLPSSIKTIGKSAFEGCSGYVSITLPDSLTTLGDYAFRYCSGITTITFPSDLDSIGSYVFGNCANLQTVNYNTINCQHTSYCVFGQCNNFTTLNIGNDVQSIPHHFFENLSQLSGTLTFPNSLKSISNNAFRGCSGITGSLIIPDSVLVIGDAAFGNCSGVTSITIGRSLNSLGAGAFGGMSGLIAINYNATNCSSGSYVFLSNNVLTTLNIGSNVQTIPDGLVSNCPNLTTVVFPASITRIGAGAFSGCGLTGTITIPPGVNTIGYGAFSSVTSISDVVCQRITPPIVESYMGMGEPYFFTYCTDKPLHVPCGSISAYQTAPGWKYFTDISGIGTCYYNVSLSTNNASMGVVRGSGQYEQGTIATCIAEPYNGYHFERWSDNNTQNPRNIIVNSDITLTAIFASNVGIANNDNSDIFLLYVKNNSIHVEGIKEKKIIVYSIDGKIKNIVDNVSGDVSIPVSSSGVYLVKIGDDKMYKVLVVRQ